MILLTAISDDLETDYLTTRVYRNRYANISPMESKCKSHATRHGYVALAAVSPQRSCMLLTYTPYGDKKKYRGWRYQDFLYFVVRSNGNSR